MMKINLIIDLQYGSTGKGLLAGWLANTTHPDVCVTCNMPNAGHTYIDRDGHKMVFKVLPNGVSATSCHLVLIGPGAVFSLERLKQEVEVMAYIRGKTNPFDVVIHPNAVPLEEHHTETERENLNRIASTMQGSAAAMVEKIMRQPDFNTIAGGRDIDWEFMDCRIYCTGHDVWREILDDARLIQAEGSQGFSLGINQRFYPYCTSRECTPQRLLSDMGLPHNVDLTTWGTLRTYPIRVGNTEGGYSGNCYYDQTELTWDDLGVTPEHTTVTGRVRRVFTFSREQLRESLWHCRPDHLFLNFCNYMDPTSLGVLIEDINEIAKPYGSELKLCGYGPAHDDVKSYSAGQTQSLFG